MSSSSKFSEIEFTSNESESDSTKLELLSLVLHFCLTDPSELKDGS